LLAELAPAWLVVFAAGIVRGFSGFGFSALCVAGLSLLLPPAQVVPPVFMLEVLASMTLLPAALRDADWRWLGWLVAGNALFIPLGVATLAWLPETPLRLLIGALLFCAALSLRSGVALGLDPTRGVRVATGVVSGYVNGLAAIGGIAVAVIMSTAQMAPAAMRATLIVLFLFTDLYALASAALLGSAGGGGASLLGTQTMQHALWWAPAMLAGIWVGQRSFKQVSPARFRQLVLNLLIAIAALGVMRALWALL
jgi:uncharacterized membrane protein YfcA